LSESVRFLLKVGFGLVLSALALSPVILLPLRLLLPPPYSHLPMLPRPGIFAACWIVSLGTAAYAVIRYSRARILVSMTVLSYLLLAYLFMFAMPAGDRWRGEKRFAEAARQLVSGRQAELASFKAQPPMFYLGFAKPVPEYETLPELKSAVRDRGVEWVILRRRDVPVLDMRARVAAFEPSYPWDSREHALNALVLMKLDR
jgi:hypothetical protein